MNDQKKNPSIQIKKNPYNGASKNPSIYQNIFFQQKFGSINYCITFVKITVCLVSLSLQARFFTYMIKTIKSILDNDVIHGVNIQNYYFPQITERDIISYVKINTKAINNQFDYTTDIQEATLFNTQDEITQLPILKNLNYTIYQFKEIYEPAHVIIFEQASGNIIIRKRWKPIGYFKEDANHITTSNFALAKAKLSEFKYNKIRNLQDKIYNISQIEISE